MLDGSLRTAELAALDAIELCATVALSEHREVRFFLNTVLLANLDAIEAFRLSQSNDEHTALNARETLEDVMRDTESAMFDLGYLAYWHESWFYIETIDDDDESDTE